MNVSRIVRLFRKTLARKKIEQLDEEDFNKFQRIPLLMSSYSHQSITQFQLKTEIEYAVSKQSRVILIDNKSLLEEENG